MKKSDSNNFVNINDERFTHTLTGLIEEQSLKLYSIETLKDNDELIFRINLFHNEKKISLDDCVKVHKSIYPYLEETGVCDRYRVEVSSVGIERALTQKEHYHYAINEWVKITTITKEKILGTLEKVLENGITIGLEDKGSIVIEFDNIKQAKTCFVES